MITHLDDDDAGKDDEEQKRKLKPFRLWKIIIVYYNIAIGNFCYARCLLVRNGSNETCQVNEE